jgi:hemolysin-activating ACP:hemolysin acyltransferase
MHSLAAIGGRLKPESAMAGRARDLGLACQFATRLPGHAQMPLGSFVPLLLSAQQVGQFKVYLNGYDECVGYVAWALLTPDVEREFIAGKPRALAEWEFSDGTSPWILDLVVAPGSLPYVLEDLRDVVFKDHAQLTYYRVKGGRRMCKRVSRNDRTTFMAAGRLREALA